MTQLRIVRGDASPEEIAALVVALAAATAPGSTAETAVETGAWLRSARRPRGSAVSGRAWQTGPGAWRTSALPD
ncbi:acyl-CoA carboxylase epsilon subunit [Acrocarpospora catenulata]|uniref:acyl-CoA carboxylase epsilon subunit n=1 Tax=Acrocarpospora catenulata TaxID=2836182 RepID=UPI001BDA70C1|nr:acyl-CoA carboxylase epsilon subunit [Acrocarpospora catenulata]